MFDGILSEREPDMCVQLVSNAPKGKKTSVEGDILGYAYTVIEEEEMIDECQDEVLREEWTLESVKSEIKLSGYLSDSEKDIVWNQAYNQKCSCSR